MVSLPSYLITYTLVLALDASISWMPITIQPSFVCLPMSLNCPLWIFTSVTRQQGEVGFQNSTIFNIILKCPHEEFQEAAEWTPDKVGLDAKLSDVLHSFPLFLLKHEEEGKGRKAAPVFLNLFSCRMLPRRNGRQEEYKRSWRCD